MLLTHIFMALMSNWCSSWDYDWDWDREQRTETEFQANVEAASHVI